MKAEPLPVVVGRNAQGIRRRAGVTLEKFAQAAKRYGLQWSSGKVGDFESGRVSPTLPTLIAVAGVLTEVTDQVVSLADLFAGDGRIEVTGKVSMWAADVRDALAGGGVQSAAGDIEGRADELKDQFQQLRSLKVDVDRHVLKQVLDDYSESDSRVAKALGVDDFTAAAHMANLWGRPFHVERDDIAGPNANAQRKGRAARDLKAQLKGALDGDDQ